MPDKLCQLMLPHVEHKVFFQRPVISRIVLGLRRVQWVLVSRTVGVLFV